MRGNRQEAVTCDTCDRWQHRKCKTGITQAQYRRAIREGEDLNFLCRGCIQLQTEQETAMLQTSIMSAADSTMPDPVANSTTLEDTGDRSEPRTNNQSVYCDKLIRERERPHERSLNDAAPSTQSDSERTLTYEIIEKGSIQGRSLLTDSQGYCYVIKERRPKSTVWRCSVRSAKLTCPARVTQKGETFSANSKDHVHAPEPEQAIRAKVTAKVCNILK
ncbi:uncharacterized protein LOC132714028 [Ruditapes philippinarum]|uniref:uncharacterized protein LOC132714028 n=1 Tax=Ruditapes philippinarum TaxID=129788 RepID=UPI00295AA654|nr:uncharacterized protein LOC132714028 [Ruditapes philippinarum]